MLPRNYGDSPNRIMLAAPRVCPNVKLIIAVPNESRERLRPLYRHCVNAAIR